MTQSRQSAKLFWYITFFTTPCTQIMLSILNLNSSTSIYLSLDNGVTMTSKRRDNIKFVKNMRHHDLSVS